MLRLPQHFCIPLHELFRPHLNLRLQRVRQRAEPILACTQCLLTLLLLGDVIISFENAFSISEVVSIEHPTADNNDFGAVLASMNEFAAPAAVAEELG